MPFFVFAQTSYGYDIAKYRRLIVILQDAAGPGPGTGRAAPDTIPSANLAEVAADAPPLGDPRGRRRVVRLRARPSHHVSRTRRARANRSAAVARNRLQHGRASTSLHATRHRQPTSESGDRPTRHEPPPGRLSSVAALHVRAKYMITFREPPRSPRRSLGHRIRTYVHVPSSCSRPRGGLHTGWAPRHRLRSAHNSNPPALAAKPAFDAGCGGGATTCICMAAGIAGGGSTSAIAFSRATRRRSSSSSCSTRP